MLNTNSKILQPPTTHIIIMAIKTRIFSPLWKVLRVSTASVHHCCAFYLCILILPVSELDVNETGGMYFSCLPSLLTLLFAVCISGLASILVVWIYSIVWYVSALFVLSHGHLGRLHFAKMNKAAVNICTCLLMNICFHFLLGKYLEWACWLCGNCVCVCLTW